MTVNNSSFGLWVFSPAHNKVVWGYIWLLNWQNTPPTTVAISDFNQPLAQCKLHNQRSCLLFKWCSCNNLYLFVSLSLIVLLLMWISIGTTQGIESFSKDCATNYYRVIFNSCRKKLIIYSKHLVVCRPFSDNRTPSMFCLYSLQYFCVSVLSFRGVAENEFMWFSLYFWFQNISNTLNCQP